MKVSTEVPTKVSTQAVRFHMFCVHMSNGIFNIFYANRPKTEVRHFCLKHLKKEIHACKRDRKLQAFPQIPFPENPQARDARLKNDFGTNFGNKILPSLTCSVFRTVRNGVGSI